MNCVRAIVYGKVQGVFFRVSTQEEAKILDLVGYTRNKQDGSVEIVACGEYDRIEQLIEFCKNNPGHSLVKHIDIQWIDPPLKMYQDFEVQ